MRKGLIDQRRTENEQNLAGEAAKRPERSRFPQFTLRGLILFSTAITVCLSLVVTATRVQAGLRAVVFACAMLLTWIVLCVTYRRLRFRVAIRYHWLGLVVAFAMILTALLEHVLAVPAPAATDAEVLIAIPGLIGFGFLISSFASFSVFAVTLVVLLVRAAARRR